MNKFQEFKAYLMYRKAVMMATKAHKETGKRYFVLPNYDKKIHLVVADIKNFKRLRLKGYIHPDIKVNNLYKLSFYYTPNVHGGKVITENELKEKQVRYQDWYSSRLSEIKGHKPNIFEKRRRDKEYDKMIEQM